MLRGRGKLITGLTWRRTAWTTTRACWCYRPFHTACAKEGKLLFYISGTTFRTRNIIPRPGYKFLKILTTSIASIFIKWH